MKRVGLSRPKGPTQVSHVQSNGPSSLTRSSSIKELKANPTNVNGATINSRYS
jgi:hypothetical protein